MLVIPLAYFGGMLTIVSPYILPPEKPDRRPHVHDRIP
jgi:hypothetical protein